MVAFKLTQVYPAHVPYETSPQHITFSTTAILSQTIDNLGKQLHFHLLLQIPRDLTKLVFLLYQLSSNYYVLWPLLSEMFSPSKMLIAKLSLVTLTHTFIKCKAPCVSDGSEDSRVRVRKSSVKVFKLTLMLPHYTVITLSCKTHILKSQSCHLRHLLYHGRRGNIGGVLFVFKMKYSMA